MLRNIISKTIKSVVTAPVEVVKGVGDAASDLNTYLWEGKDEMEAQAERRERRRR